MADNTNTTTKPKKKNYNKPKTEEKKAYDAAFKAYVDSMVKAKADKAGGIDEQIKSIADVDKLVEIMLKCAGRINGLKAHSKRKKAD